MLSFKKAYFSDRFRGREVATQLMEHALVYGQDNKYPFIFVENMSFQALGFYQKMGFKLEFTRSGYKHGTSLHYLRKGLIKNCVLLIVFTGSFSMSGKLRFQ